MHVNISQFKQWIWTISTSNLKLVSFQMIVSGFSARFPFRLDKLVKSYFFKILRLTDSRQLQQAIFLNSLHSFDSLVLCIYLSLVDNTQTSTLILWLDESCIFLKASTSQKLPTTPDPARNTCIGALSSQRSAKRL